MLMQKNIKNDPCLSDIVRQQQVSTLFQPIVSIEDGSVFGYEALARGPEDSQLYEAKDLFANAENQGYLSRLDQLASQLAVIRFQQRELPAQLFINFSPDTLTADRRAMSDLVSFMGLQGMSPEQVVIEVTEHSPIDDVQKLCSAVDRYRKAGFKIALDDLGSGYSGLQLWSELKPDYVKLDRHFIQHIHLNDAKQYFVQSIQELAEKLGCLVIAEGIENRRELETVCRMGIPLVQGYYICRPIEQPLTHPASLATMGFMQAQSA